MPPDFPCLGSFLKIGTEGITKIEEGGILPHLAIKWLYEKKTTLAFGSNMDFDEIAFSY